MHEQQGAFGASRQSREDLGGAAELASGAYAQVGHSVCIKAKAPALRRCNGLCGRHLLHVCCHTAANCLVPCKSCLEVAVAGSLRLAELYATGQIMRWCRSTNEVVSEHNKLQEVEAQAEAPVASSPA